MCYSRGKETAASVVGTLGTADQDKVYEESLCDLLHTLFDVLSRQDFFFISATFWTQLVRRFQHKLLKKTRSHNHGIQGPFSQPYRR